MSEPLDLDRAEADFFVESSEDSCRCPHDHERARALIAELRKLREEKSLYTREDFTRLLDERDAALARATAAEARVADVEIQNVELKRLIDPAVTRAARQLQANMDMHPAGCCGHCTAGLARLAELESWIVWCSKASFPLGALSDKAAQIATRRAGRAS